MSQPFFSIIMPVYKTQKTLERAVRSICEQTYPDWELILVDDCSPDICGALCDSLAEKDSRIRTVHKPENEGLGPARNTGMEQAVGSWILFIDSDDWLDRHCLQSCYSCICEHPTQIVVFGLSQDFEDENGTVYKQERLVPVAGEAATPAEVGRLAMKMDLGRYFSYAWNKAYSSVLLLETKMRFDNTLLMEDFVFNIRLFEKATRITVLGDVLYHYVRPVSTTLATTYSPRFFDLCKMRYKRERDFLDQLGVSDSETLQIPKKVHMKHLFSAVVRTYSVGMPNAQRRVIVRAMRQDPETVAFFQEFCPDSLLYIGLKWFMQLRWTWPILFLAKCYAKKKR